MNREIKFRAWDKVLNRWCKGGLCIRVDGDACDSDRYELMQYTGLKDKNGVEIYEADILRVANGSINGQIGFRTYAVEHKPKGFNLPYFCWNNDGSDDSGWSHYCEVIGNVYENPELLETGK